MRVARGRSDAVSGSGVDVMTSLVGDADPGAAVVPSFCKIKIFFINSAFSSLFLSLSYRFR